MSFVRYIIHHRTLANLLLLMLLVVGLISTDRIRAQFPRLCDRNHLCQRGLARGRTRRH